MMDAVVALRANDGSKPKENAAKLSDFEMIWNLCFGHCKLGRIWKYMEWIGMIHYCKYYSQVRSGGHESKLQWNPLDFHICLGSSWSSLKLLIPIWGVAMRLAAPRVSMRSAGSLKGMLRPIQSSSMMACCWEISGPEAEKSQHVNVLEADVDSLRWNRPWYQSKSQNVHVIHIYIHVHSFPLGRRASGARWWRVPISGPHSPAVASNSWRLQGPVPSKMLLIGNSLSLYWQAGNSGNSGIYFLIQLIDVYWCQ